MANTQQQDFDFWQFISCARCRMPFSMENGTATIPFWLTECAHILCNNHLNPDQSCAQCGSQGIQLTPLQREMETPMSEWFQSIPLGLDLIAYATKFQQEIMASEVRYHKSRHQQLRQLLERLKREVTELKKCSSSEQRSQTCSSLISCGSDNDALRQENNQYRHQIGHLNNYQDPSDTVNANRKRQKLSAQQFDFANQRPMTGSSPLSVTAPSGPQRLTLEPGQHPAELSSHKQLQGQESMASRTNDQYPSHRPESARSLEQYTYIPQENKAFHPPPLSYTQNAPREFQRRDTVQQAQRQPTDNQTLRPAPSARFKPAIASYASLLNNPTKENTARHNVMGPPPTPQASRNDEGTSIPNRAPNEQASIRHSVSNNHSLLPPGHRQTGIPATPVPGQPISGVAPRRFFQPGGLRASHATLPAAGQRTPFVSRSGQQGGFV